MTDNQNEKQEAKFSSPDSTQKNKPANMLQRFGALAITLLALWYLFGIPGYILFEKFLGSDASDAAELDIPQTATE